MEESGSIGGALVWYRHTAISEIFVHALCHMGGISLTEIPLWKRVVQLVQP